MVKGSTRQVILVKSPDPKLFEEAIFIVREEALKREGITAEQVIQEAQQAADGYLRRGRAEEQQSKFAPSIWVAVGAVCSSVCWVFGVLMF